MSDSSIRANPSMDDPSNQIPSVSAFSAWMDRDRDIFWHPLDIRELETDEFYSIRLNFLKHLRYVC